MCRRAPSLTQGPRIIITEGYPTIIRQGDTRIFQEGSGVTQMLCPGVATTTIAIRCTPTARMGIARGVDGP